MKRILDASTTLLTWAMVSCLAVAFLVSPQAAMADDDPFPGTSVSPNVKSARCLTCIDTCMKINGLVVGACAQNGNFCNPACACKANLFGASCR